MKPDRSVDGPVFVIGREKVEALGMTKGPPPRRNLAPWLVRLEQSVTEAQLETARQIAASSVGTSVDAQLLHRRPERVFFQVVLLISIVTGLIVIFVATALTSVESAADARVLHSVGAAPALMRGHLAAHAGYLALLGCLLSVPAGLIPALGLVPLANFPLELAMPWAEVLVCVLGLPAAAYGGTWLFARLSRRSLGARPPAI